MATSAPIKLFEKVTPRWVIFAIEQVLLLFAMSFSILAVAQVTEIEAHPTSFLYILLANAIISGLGMYIHKTYVGIIRYSELRDVYKITKFTMLQLLAWVGMVILFPQLFQKATIGYTVIGINAGLSTTLLILFRVMVKEVYAIALANTTEKKERLLIFGANDIGVATKRVIEFDKSSNCDVTAFVDYDYTKVGKILSGKQVISSEPSILRRYMSKHKITQLIIADERLTVGEKEQLSDICNGMKVKIKSVPPLQSWINGKFNPRQLKQLTIEALLNRDQIQVLNKRSQLEFENETVLVTGAAGSIGSEICRQLIKYKLKRLILLDQSETGLYEIRNELNEHSYANGITSIDMELLSIREKDRLVEIMQFYKPKFVFHAAAYKHVPILEDFPLEVAKTNILGTMNVAEASMKACVKKFVMLSTDKAVNPTNLMGASKRIAEMYVQLNDGSSCTQFITTRFGNVLGSNGSVVPLFKKQIEAGGPLTVTHPDITRYFMTIPEAANLVLEAAVMGHNGEILVFDMGKPVKILDLARNMIKLSGLEPEKDIAIKFTGIRPGEKMYEELFQDSENLIGTHHPKILKANKSFIHDQFIRELEAIILLAEENNADAIRYHLTQFIESGEFVQGTEYPVRVRMIKQHVTEKVQNEKIA